jgi:hypothetical protein
MPWTPPATDKPVSAAGGWKPPASDKPISAPASGYVDTLIQDAKQIIPSAVQVASHPLDTASAIVQSSKDNLNKTVENLKAGNYEEALTSFARAMPILGPWAMGVKDDIDAGNNGRALARMTEAIAPDLIRYGWSKAAKLGTAESERLMQSALNPRKVDTGGRAGSKEAVRTALENSISVTEGGMNRLQGLIAEKQSLVQQAISDATRAGMKVDPRAVATRLDDLIASKRIQSTPGRDVGILQDLKDEFLQSYQSSPGRAAAPPGPIGVLDANGNPVMTPGSPARVPRYRQVPADEAQAIKVGTYGKAYDKNTSATYIKGQRALGRGWKEELEAIAPELAQMNDSEAKLLQLGKVMNRTLDNQASAPIVTLPDLAAGAGGTALAGPGGGLFAMFSRKTLDSPRFKSNLAITLNKISIRSGKPVSMAASAARAASIVEELQRQMPPDQQ